MRPSTSTTSAAAAAALRPARVETARFRCPCGRSVAAPRGSDAASSGRCSSCRARQRAEASLRRD